MREPIYNLHGEDNPLASVPTWAILAAGVLVHWRGLAAVVGLLLAFVLLAVVL